MITSLQISCRMRQWKNLENGPVFDEVVIVYSIAWVSFLAHPVCMCRKRILSLKERSPDISNTAYDNNYIYNFYSPCIR